MQQNNKENLGGFASKVHCKLNSQVHDVLSWLAIAAISASSFLIMSTVLAETATITAPFSGPTFSSSTPMQPMPGTCIPGTPCPSLENSLQFPVDGQIQQPMFCAPDMPCAPKQPEGFMPKPMGMENNQNFQPNMDQSRMNQNFQMDQQRFEMMKRGLSRFSGEINRVKAQINNFKKKGLIVPGELSAAIASANDASSQIKSATSTDALDEVMGHIQDAMSTISEWMPKLPRLAELPKIIKQADKEIAKANKTYNTDQAKVKRSNLDLSNDLGEFRQAIDAQNNLLNQIKETAKTDPEVAVDSLHDDFFGSIDDMWAKERVISTALNVKNSISQINREIKQADALTKQLKRKNIDTSELETLLAQNKDQLAELKQLAATKPIDTNALIDAVNNLIDSKQEFANKIQEITGDNQYMPDLPKEQDFQFNLPQGYNDLIGSPNQNNNFSSQVK